MTSLERLCLGSVVLYNFDTYMYILYVLIYCISSIIYVWPFDGAGVEFTLPLASENLSCNDGQRSHGALVCSDDCEPYPRARPALVCIKAAFSFADHICAGAVKDA